MFFGFHVEFCSPPPIVFFIHSRAHLQFFYLDLESAEPLTFLAPLILFASLHFPLLVLASAPATGQGRSSFFLASSSMPRAFPIVTTGPFVYRHPHRFLSAEFFFIVRFHA
jgi:hypothetical protein